MLLFPFINLPFTSLARRNVCVEMILVMQRLPRTSYEDVWLDTKANDKCLRQPVCHTSTLLKSFN
jgi:hypothetical protein